MKLPKNMKVFSTEWEDFDGKIVNGPKIYAFDKEEADRKAFFYQEIYHNFRVLNLNLPERSSDT